MTPVLLTSLETIPDPPASSTSSAVLCDGVPVDVGELFRSLPSRADLKGLVVELKTEKHKETKAIRNKLLNLHAKVDAGKVVSKVVETRVSAIEQYHTAFEAQLLKLRMEEQEDWERRNAVRIKGLPGDEDGSPCWRYLKLSFNRSW